MTEKQPQEPQKKIITLLGRRWYNSRQGNTYNTCEISIDGVMVHKTPIAYGYGSHYWTLACCWLKDNGHIPVDLGSNNFTGDYIESDSVIDVRRKRDL